jgi:GntR family transcriptional regulator/MocR family aminotransferase
MRASVLSDWLAQRLDRGNGQPIYRQLHRLLQQAILSRELPAGSKVPSSRLLAQELGIGRNTVTQVYEQLVLEGYVSSATGRGTFVADSAPDEIVGVPDAEAPAAPLESLPPPLPLQGNRALSYRMSRSFRRACGAACTTSIGAGCARTC